MPAVLATQIPERKLPAAMTHDCCYCCCYCCHNILPTCMPQHFVFYSNLLLLIWHYQGNTGTPNDKVIYKVLKMDYSFILRIRSQILQLLCFAQERGHTYPRLHFGMATMSFSVFPTSKKSCMKLWNLGATLPPPPPPQRIFLWLAVLKFQSVIIAQQKTNKVWHTDLHPSLMH